MNNNKQLGGRPRLTHTAAKSNWIEVFQTQRMREKERNSGDVQCTYSV